MNIKFILRNSAIGRFLAQLKKDFQEVCYYRWRRKKYLPEIQELMSMGGDNCSIISYNCFGGRIIQDCHLMYNTPTVGLYFMYPDYIEFLKNLKYYLTEAKISFTNHSKYPGYDERRAKWKHWYPLGLLDGKIEIHFLHYYTEEEAAEKWYRRAKRINWDNLVIFGMEQNRCTDADIQEFDRLPYEKKFFFSSKEMPDIKSNCFVEKFAGLGHVGDPYKSGHHFYRALILNLRRNHLLNNNNPV